ncbi:hypothetical protein DOY81_013326 [Sarcophaga bullata]|nr:hypothetical protein DOY81_013326 [Sarcophaga bullata]
MSGNVLTDHIRLPAVKPNTSNNFYGYDKCLRQQIFSFVGAVSCDEIDNNTLSEHLETAFKPRYAMNDKFHREDERLKTFQSWPLEWLDKRELAMSGMFYMGEEDKTKCYFCEVEIGRWEREDEPVPEHLRFSPHCPLLRRRTTNNVPISCEALERLLPPPSYDICGLNDHIEIRRNAYPEGTAATMDIPPLSMAMPTATTSGSGSASSSTSSSPNTSTFYPEFPEYAIETARLRSFAEWPRTMKQRPRNWDEDDEPWEQHALWMGKCRYLKLMKGESFIQSVVSKFMKTMSNNSEEVGESSNAVVVASASVVSSDPQAATRSTVARESQTQQSFGIACQNQEQQQQQEEETEQQPITTSNCNAADQKKPSSAIPEEKLCKICYAEEYNTAFLPCGHVVACAKCASSVTKCPLCRKPFADVMRVYFS